MIGEPQQLDPPGKVVAIAELQAPKGKAFAEFIRDCGNEAYATLIETRRCSDTRSDVVVFRVKVQRPQKVVHTIRREEILAAVFADKDEAHPEVLALRNDFPRVPHTNLREKEFPRSLCLYDQPYENVRLDWTPARFLHRVRYWLERTAMGTLHGDDQPLEPLIQGAPMRLILPGDCSLPELIDKAGLFEVFRAGEAEGEITLLARLRSSEQQRKPDSVAAVFCCNEQTHGVIRHQPANLKDLHEFCLTAGLNLAESLASKIKTWLLDKPTKEVLNCHLIVILLLPKLRQDGSRIETVEQWAFLTMKSLENIGIGLDVIDKRGGTAGYLLGAPKISKEKLIDFPVATLQVLHALSAGRAAAMNGVDEVKTNILAVGLGALGSQVFNNLIRSGFGRWTLVDHDTLLPHNCARHFLGEWAVGQNKAEAMAAVANAILDQPTIGQPLAKAIPADFLKPGSRASDLRSAYAEAELVLDFSASVAVSRHFAGLDNKARHIAAFLTPSGACLVITSEDKDRRYRLDWLEMLHYRMVLNEPVLSDSLHPPNSRFRYGNSCRDISTQLAQDDAAVWAGVASKTIKRIIQSDEAALRVYRADPDGQSALFTVTVSKVLDVPVSGWIVRFDQWVIDKMAKLRRARLPNETGGILLGNFDTYRRVCSVIDLLPSPPDSTEWPTSYIRGCAGLRDQVRNVEERTLDQIGYVGEWHSHPRGASVIPSDDDWKAYGWLLSHMQAESLPGIMLIIGDSKRFSFVGSANPPQEELNCPANSISQTL